MKVFAILFILLYNGKCGMNSVFTKSMFYFFYPVHLWAIYMIGYFLCE
ncbi:TraX family protein [Bacillus sp. JJ722]